MQETLRIHPPVADISRVACNDDIIPLSKPVVGVSGKVYNELAIPSGMMIVIPPFGHNLWVIPRTYHLSIVAYLVRPHRNPEVWGADSDKWRPERWLEAARNPDPPVGAYGNLCVMYV